MAGKKKTDRMKALLKRGLDLNENKLTQDEALWLVGALTRGNGTTDEAELERQFGVLEKLAVETKFQMVCFGLILKGLMDVTVDKNGEITFRASDMAVGKAPIRF
jgi:hypothetical protein